MRPADLFWFQKRVQVGLCATCVLAALEISGWLCAATVTCFFFVLNCPTEPTDLHRARAL